MVFLFVTMMLIILFVMLTTVAVCESPGGGAVAAIVKERYKNTGLNSVENTETQRKTDNGSSRIKFGRKGHSP